MQAKSFYFKIMKTVSVVMATYNGAKYLREQLNSIISQTYPIYELIVQDDCSTDETVAIIKEYMEKYSFIKLYVNEHNLGFNLNFKSAALKATGDYIALSDQDDVWFPNKIEKQVKTIGNYDICFPQYLWGDDINTSTIIKINYSFLKALFFATAIGHTMLCQKDFIQNESNWLPSIWYDWSLTLNAHLNRGIIRVEEPLHWHRRHNSQVTYTKYSDKKLTYQPYLYGYKEFRKLQNSRNWIFIFTYLYKRTNNEKYSLIHKFCGLLLKKDLYSFIHLCFLCQKYRHVIYYCKVSGFIGWIRGFFFPIFHAYNHPTLYKDFSQSK